MPKRIDLAASAFTVAAAVTAPGLALRAGWTVYFDDGTSFSSMDGAPNDAPFKRVLCVGVRSGKYTLWGADWYYYDTGLGGWQASDMGGLLARLCLNAGAIGVVRKGNPISDNFENAMWRAFVERMA